MSPLAIALVFAVFTISALGAGVWLSLHLTALAALFNGKADVVASPKRPRASRETVIVMLLVFGISLGAVIAIQVIAYGAWA